MSTFIVAHTVKLKTPIKSGDETITEIKLRKPKAKDLRGMKVDGLGFSEILDLAIKIGDQPKYVIDDLEIEDAGELLKVVGDFFESGLGIGPS